MRGAGREVSREAVVAGIVMAVATGAALLAVAALRGKSYLFNSDASYAYLVARDPFGDGGGFSALPDGIGASYRYGRILYSLVGWILAGGRPGLVVWTLPTVYALSVGLLAGAACQVCFDRGAPALRGALVLLAPAFLFTLPIVFSDPLVLALIVLTYLLELRGNRKGALVCAALTLLTREAAMPAFLPLIAADLKGHGWRRSASWLSTVVPLLVWWAWVRFRVGLWPPLDPAARGTLTYPFGGLVSVASEGGAQTEGLALAVVLGLATIVFCVLVWRSRPLPPLTSGALMFALLLVFLGPLTWRLPPAAIRVMLPAQGLAILGFAALPRTAPRPSAPEASAVPT